LPTGFAATRPGLRVTEQYGILVAQLAAPKDLSTTTLLEPCLIYNFGITINPAMH